MLYGCPACETCVNRDKGICVGCTLTRRTDGSWEYSNYRPRNGSYTFTTQWSYPPPPYASLGEDDDADAN